MKRRFMKVVVLIAMFFAIIPASAHATGIGNYGANLESAAYATNVNPFVGLYGQCTWYCWGRAYEKCGVSLPCRGNANNWLNEAAWDTTPSENSIAVWTSGFPGHVAFVEAVDGNTIYISEANLDSIIYSEGYMNAANGGYRSTYGNLPYSSNWPGRAKPDGYIHLGSTPASSTPSPVSLHFEKGERTSSGSTNAILATRLTISGALMTDVSRIGAYIYSASGNELAHIDEAAGIDYNYGYLDIWYDVNSELHYTLSSGTSYRYKFFAVVGGTTYWSDEWSFQTSRPKINFDMGDRFSKSETNAVLSTRITLEGAVMTQVSHIGVYLYNAAGQELTHIYEDAGIDKNYNYLDIWYDINTELHYSLTRGTTYRYRFFGVINGETFWGDELSFTTDGPIDTTPPTIANIEITDITDDGYTVSCNVTDDGIISRVEFPTWTLNNDQDDLIWHQGNISGNTASYRVKTSDHNYETDCFYRTHIYAWDVNGNKMSAAVQDVYIGTVKASWIYLNQTSIAMEKGEISFITATVTPANALNKKVEWNSSNPSVATVNDGMITAVGIGTTTITAEVEAVSATCNITVSENMTGRMQVSVESKSASSGDTIDVAIKIDNNPGIAMTQFQITYDTSLILDSVIAGDIFSTSDYIPGVIEMNPYTLMFYSTKADLTENGTLATLKFHIAEDVVEGSTFSINIGGISCNIDENKVGIKFTNGRITIEDVIFGDVNRDGAVNGLDVLRLGKYLTGWNVEVDLAAADVNGDGEVNGLDQLRLAKYCAGWPVSLGT